MSAQSVVVRAVENGDVAGLAQALEMTCDASELGLPLYTACLRGRSECVRLLLAAHAAVDQPSANGDSPLLIACNQGEAECVQLLLAAHAAVDQTITNGVSPLYTACSQGKTECVQLLLAAHAAVDQPDADGQTPLLTACNQGKAECVRLLLAADAAIDQPNADGVSPLYTACDQGEAECVRLLLTAHAAVDQPRANGISPLLTACSQGKAECVRLLLNAHAAVDQPSANGKSPLYTACNYGNTECVQLLLTAHAAVDQPSANGDSPLLIACNKGDTECVQLLLAAHAAVDQPDVDGHTPLRAACWVGSRAIAKLLLDAGANAKIRGACGSSALKLAESRGYAAIAKLIRTHRLPPAQPMPSSQAERQAASAAADASAAALLAEEEATVRHKGEKRPKGKKLRQKAAPPATKSDAGGASNPDVGCDMSVSEEAAVRTMALEALGSEGSDASLVAAADNALQDVVGIGEHGALVQAIDAHHLVASETALAEARQARDRLKARRKKESQKLRCAHAGAMGALRQLQDAGTMANAGALQEGVASVVDHAGVLPALDAEVQLARVQLEELSLAQCASDGVAAAAAEHAGPVELTADELANATDGFADARLIGSGGSARVFLGATLHGVAVAVKLARSGQSAGKLEALKREVALLQGCSHPHLLPLLGYHLEREAPCLVFPLMRGGSLADRLKPHTMDPAHSQHLGLPARLAPLSWREQLRIMTQSIEALLYLHTPVPGGKGSVVSITWRSHGDHVARMGCVSRGGQVAITWRSWGVLTVASMWRSLGDHVVILWRARGDHVGSVVNSPSLIRCTATSSPRTSSSTSTSTHTSPTRALPRWSGPRTRSGRCRTSCTSRWATSTRSSSKAASTRR